MITQEHVKLAAKLYSARDSVKFLYGEQYLEKIKPIMAKINSLTNGDKSKVLKTVVKLIQAIAANHEDSGTMQMMVLAAAVEILEPSEVPK